MAAVPNTEWDTPKPNAQLVSRLNQATDKQREKAKAKAEAVLKLKDYLALDFPLAQALHCAAA